jgi:hypothetical protein
MRLPRMTTRRWMITAAVVALVFGFATWTAPEKSGPGGVLFFAVCMLASFTIPLFVSVAQFPGR